MNNDIPRKTAPSITLLIAILLSAGWLALHLGTVTADALQPEPHRLAGPTPTPIPQPAGENNAPGVSPLVGILILLAPLAFMVWKSRGVKEPKITSACCLPVIDENKRPFQIIEDEQEENAS